MDFEEEINQFRSKIPRLKSRIQAEEGTKNSLILPLFDIMGYDTRDPFEVNPEYTADFGTKQKEKVDYAICINDVPVMLIEAKPFNVNLSLKHCSQLFRYFSVSEAKIGILTNGLKYMFFSDLVDENKMDEKPFFTIDLEGDLSDQDLAQLKKFRKEEFDVKKIVPTAMKLKNQNELLEVIKKEMDDPSDDLVRYFSKCIYEGQLTKKVVDKYKPLVKSAFEQVKRESVEKAIKTMQQSIDEEEKTTVTVDVEENEVITTEEEVFGHIIVRAICSNIVGPERITIRDNKTYCPIFLDDNNRKPICALHFDSQTKKYIEIPDDSGNKVKYPVQSVQDIYNYQTQIRAVVQKYLESSKK